MPDSSRQSALDRPSVGIQAHSDSLLLHAKFFSPGNEGLSSSKGGKKSVGASVSRLCLTGGPAHVAGLVVFVVVDAIKGVGCTWPASDIDQEVFEGLPALTDGNAPSPIPRERGVVGFATPPSHVRPDGPLWGSGLSMSCVSTTPAGDLLDVAPRGLVTEASAASGVAGSQGASENFPTSATEALNQPADGVVALGLGTRKPFENEQSTEPKTSQIFHAQAHITKDY